MRSILECAFTDISKERMNLTELQASSGIIGHDQ